MFTKKKTAELKVCGPKALLTEKHALKASQTIDCPTPKNVVMKAGVMNEVMKVVITSSWK